VTAETPVRAEAATAPKEAAKETPASIATEVEKPGAAAEELGSIVCIIADDGVRA
jgi:hypothetical protein